jgi:hypothetical protein
MLANRNARASRGAALVGRLAGFSVTLLIATSVSCRSAAHGGSFRAGVEPLSEAQFEDFATSICEQVAVALEHGGHEAPLFVRAPRVSDYGPEPRGVADAFALRLEQGLSDRLAGAVVFTQHAPPDRRIEANVRFAPHTGMRSPCVIFTLIDADQGSEILRSEYPYDASPHRYAWLRHQIARQDRDAAERLVSTYAFDYSDVATHSATHETSTQTTPENAGGASGPADNAAQPDDDTRLGGTGLHEQGTTDAAEPIGHPSPRVLGVVAVADTGERRLWFVSRLRIDAPADDLAWRALRMAAAAPEYTHGLANGRVMFASSGVLEHLHIREQHVRRERSGMTTDLVIQARQEPCTAQLRAVFLDRNGRQVAVGPVMPMCVDADYPSAVTLRCNRPDAERYILLAAVEPPQRQAHSPSSDQSLAK